MALTWEDVLNKQFQHTKFREGYDQDEVDDFLDAVAEEIKRLAAENEQLRAGLGIDPDRESTLDAGQDDPAAVAPVLGSPEADGDPLRDPAAGQAAPAVDPDAQRAAALEQSSSSAAAVLAMAQRLHDEHVAQGEQRRAAIVAEAEQTASQLVGEAEQTREETLAELEASRVSLESEVERLRGFETDYRTRLTSYIEGQLREIRSQERVEPRGERA